MDRQDSLDDGLAPPSPRPRIAPSRLRNVTVGFAQVALGIVGAVLVIGADSAHVPGAPFVIALGLSLGTFLHVIVHGAGHTVAGLAIGRRLLGVGVGRWRLESTRLGWRPRRAGNVKGIGGFALMWPREGESRLATAAFLLGGPAANLLAATLVACVLDHVAPVSPVAMVLGLCFVGIGVVMGCINLVPFTMHGWSSDGRGLAALASPGRADAAARTAAVQALVTMSMAGIRPRELPMHTLGPCPDDADGANLGACFMHALAALDRDDLPAARQALRLLVNAYPSIRDGARQAVALLVASQAVHAGRADLLRAWRPACEGGLLDHRASLAWLDAELALASGDLARAAAHLDDAEARCARLMDLGAAAALTDSIARTRSRMGQAPAAPAPPLVGMV